MLCILWKRKALYNARFLHAQEYSASARLLLENGNYKRAANRSDYAFFHAMRAVLAFDGIDMMVLCGVIYTAVHLLL